MAETLIEDVGISRFGLGNAVQGPIIRQLRGAVMFQVDFKDSREWLLNPLKIVPEGTVGEANKRVLHEKLDEFIDWYLKEKSNG